MLYQRSSIVWLNLKWYLFWCVRNVNEWIAIILISLSNTMIDMRCNVKIHGSRRTLFVVAPMYNLYTTVKKSFEIRVGDLIGLAFFVVHFSDILRNGISTKGPRQSEWRIESEANQIAELICFSMMRLCDQLQRTSFLRKLDSFDLLIHKSLPILNPALIKKTLFLGEKDFGQSFWIWIDWFSLFHCSLYIIGFHWFIIKTKEAS